MMVKGVRQSFAVEVPSSFLVLVFGALHYYSDCLQ